ncbi:MAG: hypothetical protein LBP76_06700 [Treponema sp.]|jgi:hypothetical protein|nr:hypothetical protein [Treponema sp.]
MALFSQKKWPCRILAAYLAVSIMRIFTFLAVESFRSFDSLEDGPASDSFFISIDYTIDCLAEGRTITRTAKNSSFSPLRNGHLRLLMPFGIKNGGAVFSQSSLNAVKKIQYFNVDNIIPLKLLT